MKTFITILILGLAIVAGLYFLPQLMDAPRSLVRRDRPGAPAPTGEGEKAAAVLREGQAAARDGDLIKARTLYEQLVGEHPDTWSAREASLRLGDIYLKEGRKKEAIDAFRGGLPNLTEDRRASLLEDILRLERELAGKKVEPPLDDRYVVRRGDTLSSIAALFKVTVEQIKLANHRTDDRINPGDVIQITRRMPTVTISKKDLKLRLFFKKTLVKDYPVGIGKEDLTPSGAFTIGSKVKNPPWYRPGGRVLPYGHPENILGTRWMTLIPEDKVQRGYGIHGTTVPQSVPGRTSAGCVRMLNRDVEELFEWVPMGTEVTITDD